MGFYGIYKKKTFGLLFMSTSYFISKTKKMWLSVLSKGLILHNWELLNFYGKYQHCLIAGSQRFLTQPQMDNLINYDALLCKMPIARIGQNKFPCESDNEMVMKST